MQNFYYVEKFNLMQLSSALELYRLRRDFYIFYLYKALIIEFLFYFYFE